MAEVLHPLGERGHGDVLATNLAYGMQRRLEIARALASEPGHPPFWQWMFNSLLVGTITAGGTVGQFTFDDESVYWSTNTDILKARK